MIFYRSWERALRKGESFYSKRQIPQFARLPEDRTSRHRLLIQVEPQRLSLDPQFFRSLRRRKPMLPKRPFQTPSHLVKNGRIWGTL